MGLVGFSQENHCRCLENGDLSQNTLSLARYWLGK